MHNPAGHKQARKPQNTQSSIQLSAKTINVKKWQPTIDWILAVFLLQLH